MKNILIIIFLIFLDLVFLHANPISELEPKNENSDSLRIKQYNSVSNFYPNPLRISSARMDVLIHKESLVSIKIFNLRTQLFSDILYDNKSLIDIKIVGKSQEFTGNQNVLPKGNYNVAFEFSTIVPSGIYIVIVQIENEVFARKFFIQN